MVDICKRFKYIVSTTLVFAFTVYLFKDAAGYSEEYAKKQMDKIVYGRHLINDNLKRCFGEKRFGIYDRAAIYEITDKDIINKVMNVKKKCIISRSSHLEDSIKSRFSLRKSIESIDFPEECGKLGYLSFSYHHGMYGFVNYNPFKYELRVCPHSSSVDDDSCNSVRFCTKWRLFILHNMDQHGYCPCIRSKVKLDTRTYLVLLCDKYEEILPRSNGRSGEDYYEWITEFKRKYDKFDNIKTTRNSYKLSYTYFLCNNGKFAESDKGAWHHNEWVAFSVDCGVTDRIVDWYGAIRCPCDECKRITTIGGNEYCGGIIKGKWCADRHIEKWGKVYGGYYCLKPKVRSYANGEEVTNEYTRSIYSTILPESVELKESDEVKKVIQFINLYDPNLVYE